MVRVAVPGDRAALSLLLARTWRRHGSAALEDQGELLQTGISTISMTRSEAHAFLGLHLRGPAGSPPQVWADLNLAALETGNRVDGSFEPLIKAAAPQLSRVGATGVVCLAPPGWLQEGLARAGFREEDRVITYVHKDPGNLPSLDRAVTVRPSHAGDAAAVLETNALAFGPFWQYDDSVVLTWMLTSDHSVVAEVQGQVAGFSITTTGMAGNYAHLIRIATHPRFRGQGIGRQLVIDALHFARAAGTPGLALNTQASNRVSRRLYESLGFRATGHILAVMVYRL